ncbi:DUF6907 domain-containing protein [Streptomyces sp. NBC_00648]|uniref:DUF6907 domain-containing protein n=1 Tax=Streptomyces sp. NBC_00648 TaxID=2975797 RepID=UPI003243E79F
MSSEEERARRSVDLAREHGELPVYGPTEPQFDEGVTPDVIVRVDYALSREQLVTALGIGFAEIAADRAPEALTVEEVRAEVEGFLGSRGIMEVDDQMERDAQRTFPPEQQHVMQLLTAAVERAYPAAGVSPARESDTPAPRSDRVPAESLDGIDPELLAWHQGALEGDPAVCGAEQPGRRNFPCINNRAHHPEHRDVLGRTWPLHEEQLFVARPRLTAGADGAVTVPTLDHGPVTLTCPTWCHGHEDTPKHRVDLAHEGDDIPLIVTVPGHGPVTVMTGLFEQRPFATRPPGTGVFLNLEIDGACYPLTPDGIRGVAEDLLTAVVDLRVLAARLGVYAAQDGGER